MKETPAQRLAYLRWLFTGWYDPGRQAAFRQDARLGDSFSQQFYQAVNASFFDNRAPLESDLASLLQFLDDDCIHEQYVHANLPNPTTHPAAPAKPTIVQNKLVSTPRPAHTFR